MTTANPIATKGPGVLGRLRSRQAGNPSGLLGWIIGRAMVTVTASANDRALELLPLGEPRTVLEIGFGQGRTVAKLIELGHQVLGVEVSKTMISQATARNRGACGDGRAKLVVGDGRLIPFDDQSADVAFTVHTVYFMPDPQITLNEAARVLRPGGRLVIASLVGDDEMAPWMDRSVYRIPTISEITKMLVSAGFDEIVHHASDDETHTVHWFVADLPS